MKRIVVTRSANVHANSQNDLSQPAAGSRKNRGERASIVSQAKGNRDQRSLKRMRVERDEDRSRSR